LSADAPTILATSGGIRRGTRSTWAFAPLIHFGVELAGVVGRAPRICYIGTAGGDQTYQMSLFDEAARAVKMVPSIATLYPMPNYDDMAEHLLGQDLIWVGGGSVANLLALWRLHGLDAVLHRAWQEGVVLSGVSAGSLCWHLGGTTDSFGPDLQRIDALGWLPYSNGVHYDSEAQRRPLFQQLVADGSLPMGYATDDGVGLYYRGTELVEAVSEVRGKGAYVVRREGDQAVEERIEPRLLPGAA
jgi:peptidase E